MTDLKDLWISILKRLLPTIQKSNFLTWFTNTLAVEIKEKTLIIAVPTTFARQWISEKYGMKILQAAKEINSEIETLEYEVKDVQGMELKSLYDEVEPGQAEKKVRKVKNANEVAVAKGDDVVRSKMLNNRYTLNSFVVGNENRLPHAACMAVSNMPGGIYNPLYIYGKVGLGKTHLLQAVGNEILKTFPGKVVKYITAERFVTEVVEAIGKRYTHKFKDQYRNVDVLLVDDVQFFARKDSSQQEFFHTFNELYDRNKQIVITSDRCPSELDDLDERIKSRFGMGMVVELLFPEFEARLAILQQKCQEFQMIVDPEVLSFIASNVHNSVRELEGVLRQLIAETQLNNRVPTIKDVAEIIKRLNKAQEIIGFDVQNKQNQAMARTVEDVIKIVADYYKVEVTCLTGPNRHKEYAVPRQVCMYLIKHELGESYERIGLGFGGRNHTTVMHACNKTAQKLKKDLRLIRDVNTIKREMGL